MNLIEGIVTVIGALLVFLGTFVTVRGKKGPDQAAVTNGQVSESVPLEKRAFRMMLDLQGRVESVECELGTTKTELTATNSELEQTKKELHTTNEELQSTNGELSRTNKRLTRLAEENRRFRTVLRGVLVRLERIAEWVREGHQPPPPYTADDIMGYVLDEFPNIRGDDAF